MTNERLHGLEIKARGTNGETRDLLARFLPPVLESAFYGYAAHHFRQLEFNDYPCLGHVDGYTWLIGVYGSGKPDSVVLHVRRQDRQVMTYPEFAAVQQVVTQRAGIEAWSNVAIGPVRW